MRFFKYFNRCVFGWFASRKINNPIPAGQAQHPQFRIIELFAWKVAKSAVIVSHSSNDLQFFIDRTLERQYRHFRLSQID